MCCLSLPIKQRLTYYQNTKRNNFECLHYTVPHHVVGAYQPQRRRKVASHGTEHTLSHFTGIYTTFRNSNVEVTFTNKNAVEKRLTTKHKERPKQV
jgi:hypothetical protein